MMYVNINMPSLQEFDVRPAVLRFITEKERRPGLQTPHLTAAYYKGVFPVADAEKIENLGLEKK